jgi:hypothetical protein
MRRRATLPVAGVLCAALATLPLAAGGSASRSLVIELKPRDGSGVSGTATLALVGGHPRIVVVLKQPVPVRGSLPAHLHIGSCAVVPNLNVQSSLRNVVDGRSVTVLRYTSWATLRSRTYSIHVHAPTYDVVACGTVPRAR